MGIFIHSLQLFKCRMCVYFGGCHALIHQELANTFQSSSIVQFFIVVTRERPALTINPT